MARAWHTPARRACCWRLQPQDRRRLRQSQTCDYADAILNRKANVKLLCHESMSSYAARHLRRLARDAAREKADATDYTLSATARSFVPFYAQRISSNIVMHSARNALEHVKRLRRDPLRTTA